MTAPKVMTSIIMFIWGDQVTSDFDTWKTLSSRDAHSLETSTIGLNNPPTDFELSNNSPAIDAGIDVGLSYDFAGKPVPKRILLIWVLMNLVL